VVERAVREASAARRAFIEQNGDDLLAELRPEADAAMRRVEDAISETLVEALTAWPELRERADALVDHRRHRPESVDLTQLGARSDGTRSDSARGPALGRRSPPAWWRGGLGRYDGVPATTSRTWTWRTSPRRRTRVERLLDDDRGRKVLGGTAWELDAAFDDVRPWGQRVGEVNEAVCDGQPIPFCPLHAEDVVLRQMDRQ
jgi:hypothetical protein